MCSLRWSLGEVDYIYKSGQMNWAQSSKFASVLSAAPEKNPA